MNPDYHSVAQSAYVFADTFIRYSQTPPTATLEDYTRTEASLKSWLFENSTVADDEVLRMVRELILDSRNFVKMCSNRSIFDCAGGRPTEKLLHDFTNDQQKKVDDLSGHIRSIAKKSDA